MSIRHRPLVIGRLYYYIDNDYVGGQGRLIGMARDTCTGAVSLALRSANGNVELLELSLLRSLRRITLTDDV